MREPEPVDSMRVNGPEPAFQDPEPGREEADAAPAGCWEGYSLATLAAFFEHA